MSEKQENSENTGDRIYDFTVRASSKYKLTKKRLINLTMSKLQIIAACHVSSKSQ